MSILFEEIDSQPSPIGTISLRRRRIPVMGDRDIYEVKLGDEFLMSSYFVDGEVALADCALSAVNGEGLSRLATHLVPGGVFGFWSNEPPDAPFTDLLSRVFASVEVHEVDFRNPFQNRMATNTVYVGT